MDDFVQQDTCFLKIVFIMLKMFVKTWFLKIVFIMLKMFVLFIFFRGNGLEDRERGGGCSNIDEL